MKIICIHQSSDLYGSDRSFLQIVEYLFKSGRYTKITIVLPRKGPLSDKLNDVGVEVIYMNLSLLSKTYLKKLQFGKIVFPLLDWKNKKSLIEKYDILYVNTSVILDFYLLAPFLKIKKIIHIREIPSKWLAKILSRLIAKANSLVIFNSYSTRQSFSPFQGSIVIHNSFEGFPYTEPDGQTAVSNLSIPLNILLIGRINNWKGQDFLIDALSKLTITNFKLRIVGSTATGNDYILTDLKEKVKSLNLMDKIEFIEFCEDPYLEYKNSDLVVVPSIKPEPFGRIAIEAMSLGKPIIASNHGGLPEIIKHDENGYLFEPNNIESFNLFLLRYLNNRNLLYTHGAASRRLFVEKFSLDKMHEALDQVFFKDII